jgi:hypothetical protein
MTEPSEMIQWLDKRIASATTWLDNFGRGSKRPRPETEISSKEYDVRMFEEIKAAYVKALERKGQSA